VISFLSCELADDFHFIEKLMIFEYINFYHIMLKFDHFIDVSSVIKKTLNLNNFIINMFILLDDYLQINFIILWNND
jgi:hypothetical protein